MATITECDRCGEQGRHTGPDKPNRWARVDYSGPIAQYPVELCADCARELERWFKEPPPRAG